MTQGTKTLSTRAFVCSLALTSAAIAQPDPSITREVLADAETRASLQSGLTAGHDGKFFLSSADGGERLNIGVQTQFRYTFNVRDTDEPDEDIANGFQLRRAKLQLKGRLFDGRTQFHVLAPFSGSSGTMSLEHAYFDTELNERWTVRFGQFKIPYYREASVSAMKQLASDRSVVDSVFGQGWSQGVQLGYEVERWSARFALSDGPRTRNTSYVDPDEADVALTARAEYRLGDASWKDWSDMTSARGEATGWLLGGALHWQSDGRTSNADTQSGTGVPESDTFAYTLDLSLRQNGWNAMLAGVGRHTDADGAERLDDFGLLAQAAAYITEHQELFVRWDSVLPDDDYASGDDFHTLTLGLNHYLVPGEHAFKFTADGVYFFDNPDDSSSIVRTSTGTSLAPGDEDGQFALRLQLQAVF